MIIMMACIFIIKFELHVCVCINSNSNSMHNSACNFTCMYHVCIDLVLVLASTSAAAAAISNTGTRYMDNFKGQGQGVLSCRSL